MIIDTGEMICGKIMSKPFENVSNIIWVNLHAIAGKVFNEIEIPVEISTCRPIVYEILIVLFGGGVELSEKII